MMQVTYTKNIWNEVKENFQDLFSADVYRTWFESMECLREDEDSVDLSVSNDFAAIWIQDNYFDIIKKSFYLAAGRPIEIRLKVIPKEENNIRVREKEPHYNNRIQSPLSDTEENDAHRIAHEKKKHRVSANYLLNPRNTFDNFIIGPGNQLARAACIAVANTLAKAYNPLFLYGDTGLGKTHLMHAIGHKAIDNHPDAKIVYISAEKFTNEFILAIQENTLVKFRQRYRSVDLLLIDDIHFLSGKERIQEEFFHTFNELFESQKQIVLSSDRPAQEIGKLENRLVSRFQWGMVADIKPPDLETRVAILKKKTASLNLRLPDNIITFLAERVSRNVRRMEGALTRVASYAALMQGGIDIESVEQLLQDILKEEVTTKITIEMIQKKVAEIYHLQIEDMSSKRRPANIALPRQIAMYLCRMLTRHSLQEIGRDFGGRDHGTVIHACKTVENIMEQDSSVKQNVDYLHNLLAEGRF